MLDDVKKLLELARTREVQTVSVNELNTLINAARSENVPELHDPRGAEINAFIAHFMRPGTQPIAFTTLYQIFLKKSASTVGKIIFKRYVEKHFKFQRASGIMYYRLDPTALGLVPDYTFYKDPKFSRKIYGKAKKKSRQQKQHKE